MHILKLVWYSKSPLREDSRVSHSHIRQFAKCLQPGFGIDNKVQVGTSKMAQSIKTIATKSDGVSSKLWD